MTKRNLIVLGIILVILASALWSILPIDSTRLGRDGLRLGLDLVGGVHLVYQADFPDDATLEQKNADMERTLSIIQRRIDKYGVAEPIIQKMGADRILVQLPGFTDIDQAKILVEQTGFLEFRQIELNSAKDPVTLADYLKMENLAFIDQAETGTRIFTGMSGPPLAILSQDNGAPVILAADGAPFDEAELEAKEILADGLISWIPARADDGTQLTGEYLDDAAVASSGNTLATEVVVAIEWGEQGADMFDDVAARLYARPADSIERSLGIFLDSSLVSFPEILQPSYDGGGQIQGGFTLEEAEHLANLLKSGALPMPLVKPPLFQEKVSATLGADFIDMSVKAGIIGIILVMLFMVAYYRLSGMISCLALIFYGAIVLAIFKLWPVTLTLAGLGGFILSIGMAVDANVLIFERMKEELRTGRSLGAAIEAGFNRAWSAIRDSNMTTIIVCAILYWLGSSIVASAPVMGFALTLAIGVLVSMFTAIVVTRTLLRLFVGTSFARKPYLFTSVWGKK
ncbi:protein translocase subunit SecD [Chloroflexota bacterium]